MRGINPIWLTVAGLFLALQTNIATGNISLVNVLPETWVPWAVGWAKAIAAYGVTVGALLPQFSSAKDPINMLGYVALNAAEGLTPAIQWHELESELDAGATLVDVRTPAEVADGAIPGSVNIPLDELRARRAELPEGRLIVHCKVGQRGHTAVRLLAQLGREAVNLDGGYLTWRAGASARAAVPELVN